MKEEKLYDYSKGLNAPYWIQEIKTKKGTRIWYFATPMTHSISLLLYWYLPYKLAKFYTEYEPHGKKMHLFLSDYLMYLWDFKLNQKAIYQEDRIEPIDEIVFEKTNL